MNIIVSFLSVSSLPFLQNNTSKNSNVPYLVCSTETDLKEDLTPLEKVFIEKNNYPKYVINQVFTQVKEEHKNRSYNVNMKNNIAVPITLENENEK